MQCLWRFIRNERGATAVEYCVMLSMILLVVIGAVTTVGANANSMWVRILNSLRTIVFGG